MKPHSKGRLNSNKIDQSFRQHASGSCYDFTKISEALPSAQNSLNHEAVDHCRGPIVMQDESASCAYDFSEMSEALSICQDEDRESLAFRQTVIIKLGRQAFLTTKEKREPLKVKKTPAKPFNFKRTQPMSLMSMRKCS
ncbi:hypothetical protein ACE6H2_007500 [Prunus campanulata]